MASYIKRGDSLFIPFRNGVSISDSQCRPRMYKSVQNFEKSFPAHNIGNKNIELVEYREVKYGYWISNEFGRIFICSECSEMIGQKEKYCPNCGVKMKGVTE